MAAETLFEKIWKSHVVHKEPGRPALLYVDLHLIHEVTSPQAFEGLRLSGRKVRRADLTFATLDHNIPTTDRALPIIDTIARRQVEYLAENCKEFNVPLFDLASPDQGIVHIIGPELGLTQPGKTIVCGDSHTSTHGAFGAFATGIGTSEVEHVLTTQCLWQAQPKTFEVRVEGKRPAGVTAKDIILGIIGRIGIGGATGTVIEYRGSTIEALTMDERMTVCNMSIEAGARAGMIGPDEKTLHYLEGRKYAPKGRKFDKATERWLGLRTDEGATFDRQLLFSSSDLAPQVTWGTNPSMVTEVSARVPDPASFSDPIAASSAEKALEYMDLKPGTAIADIPIDRVFIGSCTNSRLGDLQAAAALVAARGQKISKRVQAMVVPGSQRIKREAELLGLDRIFIDAGFEWRDSGCSMCLGMNPDILQPGERCASTSNRNFEGRQGKGSRTHLVSPIMAVAAALEGHFVDIRQWNLPLETLE